LIELLVVIAIIAVLAAILFPVFASVREKGWQATCLSNLKQIGHALEMYVQDYDDRIPDCCYWGRASAILINYGPCQQDGITRTLPKDTVLEAPQYPPRFIQDKLYPYIRNGEIWFCPSVGKNRHYRNDPSRVTLGFNGTTYFWNHDANSVASHNPHRPVPRVVTVSGLARSSIPHPTEAAVLYDHPTWITFRQPCPDWRMTPPAHAHGLNVLYVDSHAKYVPFDYQTPPPWKACSWDFIDERGCEGYFEPQ
jgi:prepilin-type processing-associated H-X9-DG protein